VQEVFQAWKGIETGYPSMWKVTVKFLLPARGVVRRGPLLREGQLPEGILDVQGIDVIFENSTNRLFHKRQERNYGLSSY
jgi:hypothetical protein